MSNDTIIYIILIAIAGFSLGFGISYLISALLMGIL